MTERSPDRLRDDPDHNRDPDDALTRSTMRQQGLRQHRGVRQHHTSADSRRVLRSRPKTRQAVVVVARPHARCIMRQKLHDPAELGDYCRPGVSNVTKACQSFRTTV